MLLESLTTPGGDPRRQRSRTTAAHAVRDGFVLFILRNGHVELAVAPALGAKVVSLRNLRTGREWLSHPASGLKLFRNEPGDKFHHSTLVGWDECLPTIAACTWQDRSLPDHGEAWSRAWDLDAHAWERQVIKTSVRLPVCGLHFARTLELAGHTLHAQYALENPATQPQEFLWAAHPLLALHEGDRLELTDETGQMLDGHSCLESLELQPGSPGYVKLHAGPLRQGRAGVFNARTGDRLTFEWDTAHCDTLGLWLTRGGWHGHHHLALEPAIGAPDSLAVAAGEWKRCGLIPPHGQETWRIQLRLEP
jgi:galactose mutarotase-like enzyme